MCNDISKTFPAGEFSGFDDQSVEVSLGFDDRVDLTGYFGEVLFC
jgi:hypothetical protein